MIFTRSKGGRQTSETPDNMRDLTDDLIREWNNAETDEDTSVLKCFSKRHIINIMVDVLVAGTDASRITLTNIISYMCAYPDIQAKMQQEIDDVLGLDGKMRLTARKHLPYTEAVVHEVMRHTTVSPMGLIHTTTCDTTLGEFSLPKNTMVIVNAEGIHRTEKYFKDADVFKPERWLDKDGQFVYNTYSFFPFSIGRRVCVGESFVRVELHALTAMLFQKFTFCAAEGQVVPVESVFSFLLNIPKPLLVSVQPRC